MKKTHKENNTKVIIPKEIITYLMDLADTLFEKDYYSYIEYANILIDDILDFIHTLPHAPHYNLSHTAEMRFNRYGRDLQYAFFKRKSSKHTTWYVFSTGKVIDILRYITNNHKDGKYIRGGLTLRFSNLNPIRQYKHFRFSQYSRFNWMSDCVSPALWTSIPDRAKAVTI